MDGTDKLRSTIDVAAGRQPADVVLRNGRIVNVLSCEIHEADVAIARDRIVGIGRYDGKHVIDLKGQYICPGFIDGHVHIESSLLGVPEFARVVAAHGTTAVVADPHEIANVMGAEGIRYMLATSRNCPIDVFLMLSSCVPASEFESAGAILDAAQLTPMLGEPGVLGLAEVMNFPGVVAGDTDCLSKIAMAGKRPIDGHAPGLRGLPLNAYVSAGIGSDHECTTIDEAREKLRLGLHIMIREGSQARNLDALLPLVHPETLERFMFVTDDKDVDDLLEEGQIDFMVRRAISLGMNPIHAIKLATINTARYFGLRELGAVAPGRLASITVLEDLERCRVRKVFHAGQLVAEDGEALQITSAPASQKPGNSVNMKHLDPDQFAIRAPGSGEVIVHVIEVLENRIDTNRSTETMTPRNGMLEAMPQRDVCKIAVIERHRATGRTGLGFVRGFGFSHGAIASTVGHDAHNLTIVGANDADMHAAATRLIELGGGLCVARDGRVIAETPLPIAGLMSDAKAPVLCKQLNALHDAARSIGGKLRRPFMALSFLTLSVIGKLKITDRGLVDVDRFQLVDLVA